MSKNFVSDLKRCAFIVLALMAANVCAPFQAGAFNQSAVDELKRKINLQKNACNEASKFMNDKKREASLALTKKTQPACEDVKPATAVSNPLNTTPDTQTPASYEAQATVFSLNNPQSDNFTAEARLDLMSSIQMALDNNRNLKAAEKNIKLANVKIKEARSQYEPQLSYQGVLTRMDQATVMSLGAMSVKMTDKILQDHGINYSQPIYTSKRVEYGKMMAEHYRDAAVFAVDSARVNLIYNVKKGFYDLLLAKEFVKVAKESVELIGAHVKTVKNRFNAGTASKFDLLRVEVQEANIKPNLIKSVHGETIAKNVFNNILARPLFDNVELAGELKKTALAVVELESALTTALATRDDIKAAKSELNAAETSVKLAKSENKPTVALSGAYDKALGKAVPIDKYNETWNMSLVAQVPIYDASKTKHGIETARTTLEQKKLNFDQLIENVKLEVKVAHQELVQADELIGASEKNVEQAKEALSIAQVSYDNGLNTNLEIMDAQLALTQAKTNYYQALHDYVVAFAKLEKSMGIARIAE